MEKKYVLVSLEDERSKNIAEVLGNKTCKKIIDFLAEDEASEKDIADALEIPINTVEYNLNKLLKAELIEKAKNFFWSPKGRKIDMYKVSNKSIIISPKLSRVSSKLKSIIPAAVISVIGAVLIKYLSIPKSTSEIDYGSGGEIMVEGAGPEMITKAGSFLFTQSSLWVWFLIISILIIMVFVFLNRKKL